jgi:hypothetical protein
VVRHRVYGSHLGRWTSRVGRVGGMIASVSDSEDTGDGSIYTEDIGGWLDPSVHTGNESMLDYQTGETMGVGGISKGQVEELQGVFSRLYWSPCVLLNVRGSASSSHLKDAVHNCDEVIVIAHGGKDGSLELYPESGSPSSVGGASGGASIDTNITIHSCYSNVVADAANNAFTGGVSAQGKYDDPVFTGTMFDDLLRQLKAMDRDCEPPFDLKIVCVLAGPKGEGVGSGTTFGNPGTVGGKK